MSELFKFLKGDKVLWLCVFIISIISILAVYSSTSGLAFRFKEGNTEYFLIKQFGLIVFGLIIMYVAHLIRYTFYSRLSVILFFIAIPLLIYTLLYGAEMNEATRWITLPGLNLTFQTSDFAKVTLIILLARNIVLFKDKLDDFNNAIIYLLLPVGLIVGLILPANNSTALLLLVVCMCMLFLGGIAFRHLLKLFAFTILSIMFLGFIFFLVKPNITRFDTLISRIEDFRSGQVEEGSQVEHALIAIANGGLLGTSPGNSTQKHILPHPYSDFMYAFIIEEYGFVGGVIVLLLYLIILYRGIRIALHSDGLFASLTSFGLTLLIVSQAFVNMLVAVNLLPVTGQPLPFISLGGTSLLFTAFAFGVILSISREITKDDQHGETVKA